MTFVLLLLPALSAPDDDAAAEALARFKEAYRSREIGARTAAVADLAKTDHRKIRLQLRKLLTADVPPVRMAAAKGLGGTREERKTTAQWLLAAVRPNARNVNVVIAILDALGRLEEESALPSVHRYLTSREVLIARAAVNACGKIRGKKSVPALIDLLKRIEDIERQPKSSGTNLPGRGNVGGLPGGFGGGKIPGVDVKIPAGVIETARDNSDQRRAQVLGPAVRQALQGITGTTQPDARAWKSWWSRNGRSFKVSK